MRLASVQVDRYGPLSGVEHEFDGGFEVLYGPNESGKTLLLDAILRLCDPATVDVVPEIGRVEEPPVGHAVLETSTASAPADAVPVDAATDHVLGNGTALGDVTKITPRQLRNVFVVRDADLRLDEEHEFYDATARRLADLHTAELGALRGALVDRGRLTPTTLELSSAEEAGEAAVVRADAADLAEEIRTYVQECRQAGIEAAERERVAVVADLEAAEEALARQEAAEALSTHARLTDHLETVREATAALETRDCTTDGLERLETIQRELDRIEADLAQLADDREALRAERRERAAERDELAAELEPLEARLDELEAVEEAFQRYREASGSEQGGSTTAAGIAAAASAGAGLTALAGVPAAALGLAALAVLAAAWTARQLRRRREVAAQRSALLADARDAGIDVEAVAEVPAAIRSLRDDHDRLRQRRSSIREDLEVLERRLEDLENERETLLEQRRELRGERRQILGDAGVPDVETYRDAVERADALSTERREAIASLAERLGDRPDATMDERIDHWADELEALAAEARERSEDVAPEAFDPEEREDLAAEVERLGERLGELEERLDAHEDRIDRLAAELGAIPTGRFREEPIGLAGRSVEGLAATARELDALVEELERDADVSRAAIAALERVQADEEAKLAELFGPESTTSAVLERITDGRYKTVTYDVEAESLRVEREDGTPRSPRELSRGTTDQLYLAARVGLADRLLGGGSGFLLLDDPLLPADPERLRAGFDALDRLADRGWQIVYVTAKPEVGEGMATELELPVRTFDRLD